MRADLGSWLRLDVDRLLERVDDMAEGFAGGDPYRHLVIDGAFPERWLDAVVDEFPDPADMPIQRRLSMEVKSANRTWSALGPATRNLLSELNAGPFLTLLEGVTGITGLVPDPHLFGGGQHQIRPGGKLAIHADFNRHPTLQVDRRLNLLVYLNRGWLEEWGGCLELWDQSMSRCVKRIAPVFNRCVLIATTDTSYHGHPEPLACPAGVTRKSLALYYYTNGRPPEEVVPEHSTLWQSRPGTDD